MTKTREERFRAKGTRAQGRINQSLFGQEGTGTFDLQPSSPRVYLERDLGLFEYKRKGESEDARES